MKTEGSTFPPETTQTIFRGRSDEAPFPPRGTRPASATATGQAPAPSATMRALPASTRTASAASSGVAARGSARRSYTSGHIGSSTVLPPMPSTKLGSVSIQTGPPSATAAATLAEVETSTG